MPALYDVFPNLHNDEIAIRKMVESDVEALLEISHNDAVYTYTSPFLYQKSAKFLQTAIKNIGNRDFKKKKMIIAGIYLQKAPDKLVGLAEMFDYIQKTNTITIGYRINEMYWHQGVASNAIKLMTTYLLEMGTGTIQAYVIPENIYSSKALLKNGFVKERYTVQQKNWGGNDTVDTEVYILKGTPK